MEVSGNTVRLGIAAPQGVSIFREEIWLAVKEENRAAAAVAADALPFDPVGDPPSGVAKAEPDTAETESGAEKTGPGAEKTGPDTAEIGSDTAEIEHDAPEAAPDS